MAQTLMKKVLLSVLVFIVGSGLLARSVIARTPDDVLYPQQWYLPQIQAPAAWNITTGSREVVVAVLDTGFDLDHPELVDQVWINTDEIPADGLDNDQNGFVDDVHGYDFVDQDISPIPHLEEAEDIEAVAHATIIAGIIGAEANNQTGIAGINWHVRLMNVRILDTDGIGNSLWAAQGIDYAVKNGADVINLSFTGEQSDEQLKSALKRAFEAGVVTVAAVGNHVDGGLNVDETPIYPACHGENEAEDWVIGVAASNQNDEKSSFSNYGALCTDVSAPGEAILSTMYVDEAFPRFATFEYISGVAGTSLAVPMVAGAAALLKSIYPTIPPKTVESILRLSADPISTSGEATGKVGAGRLNLIKALTLAPTFYPEGMTAAGISDAHPSSLIKLPCSMNAQVNDPCKTVYYYGLDGKRHAFPNEQVFFSWFVDFSAVHVISASSMSSLLLGKNITYHPGIRPVKFQSVPTVYAVAKGGVLRPIVSEEVAADLYGMDWTKQVHDISDAFFGNYTFGEGIASGTDYSVISETTSVESIDNNF